MKMFDLAVIGGGSAGFNAARVAAGLGKRVAIVDGAAALGGLCILKGCMPSKTLLWPLEVLHRAQKGTTIGLHTPGATVDLAALQRRKKRIISEFAAYRLKQLKSGKFRLFRSQGRFKDPHTLELGNGVQLKAKAFLIASGSRVAAPPVPGIDSKGVWTSDDVLELSEAPKSVIVLGGGVVACELALFLRRVGARVLQIQRSPRVLKEFSPAAGEAVEASLRAEGVEIHTDTVLEAISQSERGYSVRFRCRKSGKLITRSAERLLNALGREPRTKGLGLAEAGVRVDEQGRIAVNRWQQSSQPHIYAAGDVCGPHEIVHLAVAQGELAARHAFGITGLTPVDRTPLLSVVFTDPQVACIGARESELLARGKPFLKASYPFNDHGKSILMDEMRGYVTVLADPRRGRILGAEIVGPDAGELIHCFSVAMTLKASAADMLRAPWYHPTLAEIITYPLEEISERSRFGG